MASASEVQLIFRNGTTFCEGSVINTFIILTAARCFVAIGRNDFLVRGRVGGRVEQLEAHRIITHENYFDNRVENNVALVVLKEPGLQVRNNEVTKFSKGRWEIPETATVEGWGLLEHGKTPSVRKKNRVVGNPVSVKRSQALEGIRCSGTDADGICQGYAGGPVMCKTTGSEFQCGINGDNFGVGSMGVPTLFTEVLYFLDWIEEKVACICRNGRVGRSANCNFRRPFRDNPLICGGGKNERSLASTTSTCPSRDVPCYGNSGLFSPCVPDGKVGVRYRIFLEKNGWQPWRKNGEEAGTSGGLSVEAFRIQLINPVPGMELTYQAFVDGVGWMDPVKEGETAGTTGKLRKPLQAIRILLNHSDYDLSYQVFIEPEGWKVAVNASNNLTYSGTLSGSEEVERMKLQIIPKRTCNSDDPEEDEPIKPHRVLSTVRETLNIMYTEGAPDGLLETRILSINNMFPGPTIRAAAGDILEIEVVNGIQDGQNVTIHYHGIPQTGNPFADGPNLITQCPIQQRDSYLYTFPVRSAGTYWYHSHVDSQYTEGLVGVIAIHEREKEVDYYGEFTIVLNEFYHHPAKVNEAWYLCPTSRGTPPYPDTALMNGVGRYNCSIASSKNRSCSPREQKRPVFYLRQNKVYRVRLVNVGGMATFNFTVDNHKLHIIEVDGINRMSSLETEGLHLGAGQRYSVLLQKEKKVGEEFNIRGVIRTDFIPNATTIRNINEFRNDISFEALGLIRYVSDNEAAKQERWWNVSGINVLEVTINYSNRDFHSCDFFDITNRDY